MAPKTKDVAWVHVEVIEGLMYYKYCQKCIKGGGIHRLKEHLVLEAKLNHVRHH